MSETAFPPVPLEMREKSLFCNRLKIINLETIVWAGLSALFIVKIL
jgi:hypothetical protein